MGNLVAATAAFLATHFVSSTPLRGKLVAAIGEWPYRGLYSAVAFVTLGWMIWAYATALHDHLWQGPRWPPYVALPLAFALLACGYWRNPTMVGADKLLKSEEPARGDLKALVFFGGFFLLAALGTILVDRRKASNPDWPRFAGVTSNLPFVAVARGRNRLVWREIGWLRPLIGVAVYFAVLLVHPS